VAWARLLRAAEAAKIRLSTEATAVIREEHIATAGGADLHLVGRTLGHASPATTLGYVAADPSTSSSLLLG
jgi:site-specific recombinase XerD